MYHDVIETPLFRRPDQLHDPLYVIATVFNATRWRSRWKLFQRFRHHMLASGVKLCIVEVAFGDRDFSLTVERNGWVDGEYHLQLRTDEELFFKENMINLGVQRLPADWKYVAWIDADVMFVKPDWADGVLHALQHYAWIQPWSQALDLTPNHEMGGTHEAFFRSYELDREVQKFGSYYYPPGTPPGTMNYWHPGYAGACTREAFDGVGGMIDWAILGAGDHHMANCLIGHGEDATPPNIGARYKEKVMEWQARALDAIKLNVGVQRGLIVHNFHGAKINRKYWSRWKILVDNHFNPDEHLQRDAQGLWQFSSKAPIALRDQVRRYFRQRSEDEGFGGDPA